MRVLTGFVVALVLASVVGCAPRKIPPELPSPAQQIPPDDAVEDCFTLLKGESVHYSFQAGDPVNFDLHYHEGVDTYYPIRMDHATRHEGTFVAPKRQRYCLSWTNWLAAPVGLTFQREIRPRPGP